MLLVGAALFVVAGALSVSRARADYVDTCVNGTGDETISACTTAINSGRWHGSELAWAHTNRGVAYRAKGDHDRAIADYDEAIRLDPKDAVAYSNRGIAYKDKGDYDRAIADYNEAIGLDPKNAVAYNNRGVAYNAKGDPDRAIADYNEAIRLDPKYATPTPTAARRTRQGRLRPRHRRLRRGDQARSQIRTCLRQPGHRVQSQGRPRPRHRRLRRGDQARSRNRPRLQHPRLAYDAKGDHDHAIADYNEAIRLDPKNAIAYSAAAARTKQGRPRPRDRRLRRGDQARSQNMPLPTSTAASLTTPKATTTARSPTTTRRSARSQHRGGLHQPRQRVPGQGRLRPRHRRLQRGDPARSKRYASYHNRGIAYEAKGDHDRAIADHTKHRARSQRSRWLRHSRHGL